MTTNRAITRSPLGKGRNICGPYLYTECKTHINMSQKWREIERTAGSNNCWRHHRRQSAYCSGLTRWHVVLSIESISMMRCHRRKVSWNSAVCRTVPDLDICKYHVKFGPLSYTYNSICVCVYGITSWHQYRSLYETLFGWVYLFIYFYLDRFSIVLKIVGFFVYIWCYVINI